MTRPLLFDALDAGASEPAPDTGPGFRVEDIDRLMRDAYAAGHRVGQAEGYHAGQANGRAQGDSAARQDTRGAIERVIRGRLNHIEMSLRRQREKRTIAAEREVMHRAADDLQKAIAELAAL